MALAILKRLVIRRTKNQKESGFFKAIVSNLIFNIFVFLNISFLVSTSHIWEVN
jgi:hypothetical protein